MKNHQILKIMRAIIKIELKSIVKYGIFSLVAEIHQVQIYFKTCKRPLNHFNKFILLRRLSESTGLVILECISIPVAYD